MRLLLSLAVALLAYTALPIQAAPPNIVMIIGDDQGWKDYGFMGGKHVRTPNLDRLATESKVFPHGYVPTSLCRASLATMITGLYPHQHTITSNDPPLPAGKNAGQANRDETYLAARAEMVAQFEKSPNLAKLLGAGGYVSHQSGKWWEGNACRCGGFTEGMTQGDPTKGGRHGDTGLTIGRQGIAEVTGFMDQAKKAGKPFYLWYAPMMPHQPHNPPARLFNKYKGKHPSDLVAKYWAMCEWFDESIGDLLNHLDKQGLKENTIVVYLHDNGWIQDPENPRYAAKSKQSQYDGGVRTPIMIRWPGKVTPGQSQALVHSTDLAPTLLTAVGLKPTPAMTGVNLLDDKAVSARDRVFGEIFEHNAVDIHKPGANLKWRWMVQGNWKLIVPNNVRVPKEKIELYDLSSDPDELKNLAEQEPQRVAEMRKKLDQWWDGK